MTRTATLAVLAIRRFFDTVIILLFAYMVITVLAQVIGRYVFNFSIAWATETATFAQIWMVLASAGYAMRKDMHVGIDIIPAMLPPVLQKITIVAVTGAALWFLWIVFDGSFRLLKVGAIQKSPALQISMYYPYLALPVGAAYFAFELILRQYAKLVGSDTQTAMGDVK
ncbi:MAG: TRAP transporter small permease [Geminicoccaceae bacterium]